MTPTFSYIKVDEIVARAKMQLRLGDASHDDFLSVLAQEALNSLNALSQLVKKQVCLTFEGTTAKLPQDYVRYLALRLDTANDTTNDPIQNQLLNGCQMYLYADTAFLTQCGCDASGATDWSRGGFQINAGYIHLNSEVEVLEATLAYMGLNVDEDGKAIIEERYERGVSAYICYMFSLAWVEKTNQYVIEEYKNIWMAQRGKIIGRDAAQSFQVDKRSIQNMWGAFLISPIVNYNV